MKESPTTDKSSDPRARPWWWAMVFLLGFPLLLSTILKFWIGVPTEVEESTQLFERLRISEVEVTDANSLQFGQMFFCRFQVKSDSLARLVKQLERFEQVEGLPDKPITLKLDRPWWDPDSKLEGTTWHRDLVTIWSPEEQPDLFYAVVEGGVAGDEVEASKTSK